MIPERFPRRLRSPFDFQKGHRARHAEPATGKSDLPLRAADHAAAGVGSVRRPMPRLRIGRTVGNAAFRFPRSVRLGLPFRHVSARVVDVRLARSFGDAGESAHRLRLRSFARGIGRAGELAGRQMARPSEAVEKKQRAIADPCRAALTSRIMVASASAFGLRTACNEVRQEQASDVPLRPRKAAALKRFYPGCDLTFGYLL